jgi:hypothetical protein
MVGYSGTPLAKKLGITSGTQLYAVNAPAHYRELLQPLPENVAFVAEATRATNVVHFFTKSSDELAHALPMYRERLAPDAVVWVSWPKKASKVATDITEDVVREIALPLGFVDVKVCAVDEVWSGLKLVVRRELR